MCRILPLDVEGRIGLGVAQMLRGFETIGEGQVILLHAGQDVVAGAVEDSVDAVDRIAGQRLAQRLDDRNAAGGGRFEIEADTGVLGRAGKLQSVRRQQRLVGGDDMLAGADRRLDRGAGDAVGAADQLHEKVVAGIARQRHRVVEPGKGRHVDAAVLAAGARRHAGDRKRPAGAHRKVVAVALQHAHERRADGSESRKTNAQGRVHGDPRPVSTI